MTKDEKQLSLNDVPNVKSTANSAKSGASLMNDGNTEVLSTGSTNIDEDDYDYYTTEEILLLKREIELLEDKVSLYRNRCRYLDRELVKKDIELVAATRAYHKIKAEYTFMLDSLPDNNGGLH